MTELIFITVLLTTPLDLPRHQWASLERDGYQTMSGCGEALGRLGPDRAAQARLAYREFRPVVERYACKPYADILMENLLWAIEWEMERSGSWQSL